jgi:gluconate 2-dehydrogenase gamma chain
LTASGFWSSRMGVKDLQYQGNVFVDEWTGCPEAALRKLGVSYQTK